MNNKTLGNNFEKEMAQMLSKIGYWATFLENKKHIGSQPCDLLVSKNDKATMLDCKTCSSYLFPISRIEENQWLASKKWYETGNKRFALAIKYQEQIYFVPFCKINKKEKHIDLRTLECWKGGDIEDYC